MRLLALFVLLAATLAPLTASAGMVLDIDQELQLLRDGQAAVHIGGARYRFAVFSFEDPDGTGLGNAVARILSHELLMNSKVSSVGVLRYVGDLSKASGERQLRYFDKVEPLIESQGVQVAVWGTIRRSGDRVRIDSFTQISPSVMGKTFSYTFRLPQHMGSGQLTHRIGPDRILAQRLELPADQALSLEPLAKNLDSLRATPKDAAPFSGQLPLGQVYYVQQRKGEWVKVVMPSGKSGWLRAAGFCQGACAPLLAVSRFASELMAYDYSRANMPNRSERLAPDAQAFIDQLWAIEFVNALPAEFAGQEALAKLEPWCKLAGETNNQLTPSPGGAATCNLREIIRLVASLRRLSSRPLPQEQLGEDLLRSVASELARASMLDPRHAPTLMNLATLFNLLGDTERSNLASQLAEDAMNRPGTE